MANLEILFWHGRFSTRFWNRYLTTYGGTLPRVARQRLAAGLAPTLLATASRQALRARKHARYPARLRDCRLHARQSTCRHAAADSLCAMPSRSTSPPCCSRWPLIFEVLESTTLTEEHAPRADGIETGGISCRYHMCSHRCVATPTTGAPKWVAQRWASSLSWRFPS